jgi:hypothetical protein
MNDLKAGDKVIFNRRLERAVDVIGVIKAAILKNNEIQGYDVVLENGDPLICLEDELRPVE